MSATGITTGMPGRRTVIASFVAALAGGGLFGMGYGVLQPASPEKGKLVTAAGADAAGAGAGTASPTGASGAVLAGATPSPSRKVTVTTTTVAAGGGAVPQDFIKHPERDNTLVLVTINALDANDPQHVVIYLKRAQLVEGARAVLYNSTHGLQARNKAVIPLDNAQAQGVTLQNDAAFWGYSGLTGQQNRQRLAFDQFVNNVNQILAQDRHPGVYVRVSAANTVVYLAEAKLD